jgi:hypothetical protein
MPMESAFERAESRNLREMPLHTIDFLPSIGVREARRNDHYCEQEAKAAHHRRTLPLR